MYQITSSGGGGKRAAPTPYHRPRGRKEEEQYKGEGRVGKPGQGGRSRHNI